MASSPKFDREIATADPLDDYALVAAIGAVAGILASRNRTLGFDDVTETKIYSLLREARIEVGLGTVKTVLESLCCSEILYGTLDGFSRREAL